MGAGVRCGPGSLRDVPVRDASCSVPCTVRSVSLARTVAGRVAGHRTGGAPVRDVPVRARWLGAGPGRAGSPRRGEH